MKFALNTLWASHVPPPRSPCLFVLFCFSCYIHGLLIFNEKIIILGSVDLMMVMVLVLFLYIYCYYRCYFWYFLFFFSFFLSIVFFFNVFVFVNCIGRVGGKGPGQRGSRSPRAGRPLPIMRALQGGDLQPVREDGFPRNPGEKRTKKKKMTHRVADRRRTRKHYE